MKAVTIAVLAGVLSLLALLGYAIANKGFSAPPEPAALRAGRLASDFSIETFSGDTFTLSEQRGKVVQVNFWASWCVPCREEAPVLERAWQAYKDRGFVLVGVDVWDSERDARAFLQEFGITYPNGPDPSGEVAIEYGITGVPESQFIDRDGRLVRRWTGALNDQQIAAFIEEAMQ